MTQIRPLNWSSYCWKITFVVKVKADTTSPQLHTVTVTCPAFIMSLPYISVTSHMRAGGARELSVSTATFKTLTNSPTQAFL